MAKESGRPTPITTLSPRLVPQPGDDARTESTPAQNTIKVTFFSDFLLGKTRIQGFTTGSPSLGIWGSGAGLRRKREKLQGSVTSVTHKMGLRVKWGGTSAIERGQGLCFSHGLHPPPPYYGSRLLPRQERSGASSVSLHRAGVYSMNWYRWRSSAQWMDYLSQNRPPSKHIHTAQTMPPFATPYSLLYSLMTYRNNEWKRATSKKQTLSLNILFSWF